MGFPTKDDLDDGLDLAEDRFDRLPDDDTLDRTVANVEERNVAVDVFDDAGDARDFLAAQIREGETAINGSSTTLKEIGFTDVLEAAEGFDYLWHGIRATDDADDRRSARRLAQTVDVWFDSPNAIAQSGEILAANASGSGIGAWPYAARRLVLVSGTNKIVPSYEEAVARIREFALPLEDARVKDGGGDGSVVGKLLSFEYEKADDRTRLVLIHDTLGF